MKRMLRVLLTFIMSSSIVGCSNDPYVGKYKTLNNTILELLLIYNFSKCRVKLREG